MKAGRNQSQIAKLPYQRSSISVGIPAATLTLGVIAPTSLARYLPFRAGQLGYSGLAQSHGCQGQDADKENTK